MHVAYICIYTYTEFFLENTMLQWHTSEERNNYLKAAAQLPQEGCAQCVEHLIGGRSWQWWAHGQRSHNLWRVSAKLKQNWEFFRGRNSWTVCLIDSCFSISVEEAKGASLVSGLLLSFPCKISGS